MTRVQESSRTLNRDTEGLERTLEQHAAIVMIGVFSIFGTLSVLFLKQFGIGLAIAVLLDATIVRAILLPASMKLLGDWNWYLPKWLEWLPHLDHGSHSSSDEKVEVPPAIVPSG